MVRMTIELINDAPQFINTLKDRELNLRNFKIPVVENVGVTRDQFDVLDLSDNDIKRLENFPLLKRLTTLYLHNNRIQYIDPKLGDTLKNLKTITLTNNNLCELGDIDPLASCSKLEHVTLIGNPITHLKNYRMYIIFKLPTVRVIDFVKVKLAEREEARKLFKGKTGKKNRDAIGRSDLHHDDKENGKEVLANAKNMSQEDRKKIEEAIKNAKNLNEIEFLQSLLASGKVPEKGWNVHTWATAAETRDEQFVPEAEEPVETAESMETDA